MNDLKTEADIDQLQAMIRDRIKKIGPEGSAMVAMSLAQMAANPEPFAALAGLLGMLGLAHTTKAMQEAKS